MADGQNSSEIFPLEIKRQNMTQPDQKRVLLQILPDIYIYIYIKDFRVWHL